jgi:hypothetical protein
MDLQKRIIDSLPQALGSAVAHNPNAICEKELANN